MTVPIQYHADFLPASAGALFDQLRDELAWVRHGTVPRMEYYVNSVPKPYTYGTPEFARTYQPQPENNAIKIVRTAVEFLTETTFEVCFLNRYLYAPDHLGWHADNSPEMDDDRPIAVVSFGAEREIWFRKNPSREDIVVNGNEQETFRPPLITKVLLGDGSLCLMAPGMQDTHQHRIPKSGRQCGERISLTFRGYKHAG